MKYYSLALFFLFAISQTTLFCAIRRSAPQHPNSEQLVYVPMPISDRPNPIEEDRKLDQALFLHFVKILGNFGKILINPHDKVNVTSNVTQMLDGVVAVAQELTKRNNLSEAQFNRLIRWIVRALVNQGIIPPVHLPR